MALLYDLELEKLFLASISSPIKWKLDSMLPHDSQGCWKRII
jgi:hypothetical protein